MQSEYVTLLMFAPGAQLATSHEHLENTLRDRILEEAKPALVIEPLGL